MRLGQTEKYTLEGVVFYVRPDWQLRRDHQDRCREHRDDPTASDDEREAAGQARVDSAMKMLAACIARIEGLQDAEGVDVTQWSDEVRWQLPEPFVAELMERVTLYHSDERLGELTTSPETSPS